jgi:hypothetical protein
VALALGFKSDVVATSSPLTLPTTILLMRISRAVLLCAVALLTASSCDSVEDSPPSWEAARIQPRGVDGAEFGMTMAEIEAILGESILGGFISGERGMIGLMFTAPNLRGLRLFFDESGREDGLEYEDLPLDLLYIENPYKGRMKNGLGVGSTLEEVHKQMGVPDYRRLLPSGKSTEAYCFQDRNFYFHINSDTVHLLNVGFNTPMEREDQPCIPSTYPEVQ